MAIMPNSKANMGKDKQTAGGAGGVFSTSSRVLLLLMPHNSRGSLLRSRICFTR